MESMRASCGAARLLVGAMGLLLAGCPYGANVEPEGRPLPLRPIVVGLWVCDLDKDAQWADLTVGVTGDAYLLSVRVRRPEGDQSPGPWELWARPLRVGQHELWSLSAGDGDADPSDGKYLFLRLESARSGFLRLGILGGSGGDMRGLLDERDPNALASFLENPKETRAEFTLLCRR